MDPEMNVEMDLDQVVNYLSELKDDELSKVFAAVKALAAMETVEERLAAAQESGDIPAVIAAKREKFSYGQTNSNT